MSVEAQISNFVSETLEAEALVEAFDCYVRPDPEAEHQKRKAQQDQLRGIFSRFSQENSDVGVRCFVSEIANQRSAKRAKILISLLEGLVACNVVSARIVCESILGNDKLYYYNENFWCLSFYLIRRIVGGVDYKGVREILKALFDKAQSITGQVNVAILPQLNALYCVVEYIFDRNASLLPSYFIVNEIQKRYPSNKDWPHWKLSELMSSLVDTFRHTAQMVSIVGRSKLLPVVGHSACLGNNWKLDPDKITFPLRGLLPYNKEYIESQASLLRYVLEQPYSREMVCGMLNLQKQSKQRCQVLEDQLVDLVLVAMERTENEPESAESNESSANQLLWQHLSSQLIFFVLFQFASFPHMVISLHSKLSNRNLRKGRDRLMWVLLQFVSGSIQKNPLSDFLPLLKLYDLLYPEKESLQVPDVNKACATHQMAVTCIWMHLMKKAQGEQVNLQRTLPVALKLQLEFLQKSLMTSNMPSTIESDYRIALLCNAYSTNLDYFPRPMGVLVESVYANAKAQQIPMPGGPTSFAAGPVAPLSMSILDSLTVHAKMSLIHHIVTHVIKMAQTKSSLALSPALVETYSRLLVYIEIESLGIKGFISQLLPTVFKSYSWGILHTLLEMFSYRIHHIQPHYRVQLLSHLHSLAAVPQTNQTQLHLCVESTALRLITGLGSSEVQPQLSRFLSEPKQLLSGESEELNRALVLTLARAMHITGPLPGNELPSGSAWCKEILQTIMQQTPHNWSNATLSYFPQPLVEFYSQYTIQKENKVALKRSVEEEYRKWKSMSNENDIIAHFSLQGTPPLFLCLLWKMLLDNERITPIAYKVLERVGARALSAHLRTFADYVVFEFASSPGGQQVTKCIDALNDLVWKCNVVTIDRLVLCLVLRSFEGNEGQVCFFLIQLLLLKPSDFRNRVNEFVKENSPEHWKQSNWHEKHIAFHRKFAEKFTYEGLQDHSAQGTQYLPVYFGNVCVRFLPVFDIVIHRFLEVKAAQKSLETLLEHLGGLYKFHDRPITYLYNTLHYYSQSLKERPPLKRRLVNAIIGSLKDIRPKGWCLTESYTAYMQKPPEDIEWIPDSDYYHKLVARLVDTIDGKMSFPWTDWRFNEFPNPAAHALYVTCVELMGLPVSAQIVANACIDVVLKGSCSIPRQNVQSWMNAIALILTSLPDAYWTVVHDRLTDMMQNPLLLSPPSQFIRPDPFELFDFNQCRRMMSEVNCIHLLALAHAVWHHCSMGQASKIPQFMDEKLKSVVRTEHQYLYLCHLVGPFLQRFHAENTRCMMDIAVQLYEILENVDKNTEHMQYIDIICDLLYHVKYMYTGDAVKTEVEKVIRNLRPALQLRLRFITHMNIEEISLCV